MPKGPRNSDEFEKEWAKVIAPLHEQANDAESAAAFEQMFLIVQKLKAAGFAHDDALRILAYGLFHQPERGEAE